MNKHGHIYRRRKIGGKDFIPDASDFKSPEEMKTAVARVKKNLRDKDHCLLELFNKRRIDLNE
jgi:hypothetical protein